MTIEDDIHSGCACPCDHCEEECGSDCECVVDDCCNSTSSEDFDDENNSVLRGKWIYDGSNTIDEMIECLQNEIRFLTDLKTDGWFLTQTVNDDYAFIRREAPQSPEVQSSGSDS